MIFLLKISPFFDVIKRLKTGRWKPAPVTSFPPPPHCSTSPPHFHFPPFFFSLSGQSSLSGRSVRPITPITLTRLPPANAPPPPSSHLCLSHFLHFLSVMDALSSCQTDVLSAPLDRHWLNSANAGVWAAQNHRFNSNVLNKCQVQSFTPRLMSHFSHI